MKSAFSLFGDVAMLTIMSPFESHPDVAMPWTHRPPQLWRDVAFFRFCNDRKRNLLYHFHV